MRLKSLILLAVAFCPSLASAAITIAPMSTFGGGDGWLAPGEGGYTFLPTGTGATERGIAYGNGHLYLVSRAGGNNVRILNPTTGADLGGLNVTGISGGTFAVNTVRVGGDGAIYVANLTTAIGAASPFKVYKWDNEAAAPVAVVTDSTSLPGARLGDDLAIIGSGSSTRLAAGYGNSPVIAGNNGYAIADPTTGAVSRVAFAGTPPNAGDFRLGITFTDDSHVIGTQSITGILYRYTSFSGTNGTLLASPANSAVSPNTTGERIMSYAVVAGVPLLAMQSIGDSHVSLYDMTNPASPVWLTSGNNTTGTLALNGNGVGAISWGDATDNGNGTSNVTLYALSTNQGIQAFVVTVPEPASFVAACGVALPAVLRRRRI